MQQTSSAPKFPHAGWLGVHITTLSRKAIRHLMGKPTASPRASQVELEKLRKKFAKDQR